MQVPGSSSRVRGRAGEATVVPSQSSCWTRSLELAEWGMQRTPGLQPSLHIRSPGPRSCPQPGSLFQTWLPCQLLSGTVQPLLPWPLAPSLPGERGGGGTSGGLAPCGWSPLFLCPCLAPRSARTVVSDVARAFQAGPSPPPSVPPSQSPPPPSCGLEPQPAQPLPGQGRVTTHCQGGWGTEPS